MKLHKPTRNDYYWLNIYDNSQNLKHKALIKATFGYQVSEFKFSCDIFMFEVLINLPFFKEIRRDKNEKNK